MSATPGMPLQMPMPTAETAGNGAETHSSGIEAAVESAIAGGNGQALVAIGTQKTQATTTRITAIATPDIHEADAPEVGVLNAIATQAQGLASDAHREYVSSIHAILGSAAVNPANESTIQPEPQTAPTTESVAQIAPAELPGFVSPPKKPEIAYSLIAIPAQLYLDERAEAEKLLLQPQANYEGHSLDSAIGYYNAILAQDPTDEQWIRFTSALKAEHDYVSMKRTRASKALELNALQNELEDNKKHHIEPTSEKIALLTQLQQEFTQASEQVNTAEKVKQDAEDHYKALTQN